MIRLLTFDLDDTLWPNHQVMVRAEQACYQWIAQHCPQAAQLYTPQTLAEYKNNIAESYPELKPKVSTLRFEVLRRVFLQAGAREPEVLARQAFDVFYKVRSRVEFYPGAIAALEQLKQDYAIIAVSNGNSDLKLIGIDHLFDAHISAEEVGIAKPEPDMFHAALAHVGVSADECIHIGDHPHHDIAAAQNAGLKTIWANLENNSWPEEFQRADAEFRQLSELVQCVNSLVKG